MSIMETSVAPGGAAEVIPLSFQQEFLCLFDKGDEAGPFGPRYTIVGGWRLSGEIEVNALRGALDDVVVRHEALRTSVVRDAKVLHQRVLPPTSPHLVVVDLPPIDRGHRDLEAERFLNDIEAGLFSVREQPLLRAVLGRFDDRDWVLVLVAHHTAVDGWSIQVILRDLAVCYARRRRLPVPELPEPGQYRDYALWQRANADAPAVRRAREFWREKLRGAAVAPIRTDRSRSEGTPFSTAWYRFTLPAQLREGVVAVAAEMRSTPFMVLLGAFSVLQHTMTGATDVVVPTFTPGRAQSWTQDTVGSFFNLVPLRADLAGCETFRDVVRRVRATCLEAYAHEIPFAMVVAEAPDLMLPALQDRLAPSVFQVAQHPFMMSGERIGDITYAAMRRRTLSQPVGSDIPDGALWVLELHGSGEIVGSIGYSTNLIEENSVRAMVGEFRRVLRSTVTEPDAPLSHLSP